MASRFRPASRGARRRQPQLECLEARTLPALMNTTFVPFQPPGQGIKPFAGSGGPTGTTPAVMRHTYGADQAFFGSVTGDGTGQTIAIVDAYDQPTIFTDLAAFDQQFGLPAPPSFTKINQNGNASPLPNHDVVGGWGVEITLDVEWAHVMAPKANILLVEASSASSSNLFTAVDAARNHAGVSVVSMSWGGAETSGDSTYDSHFMTPSGHNGVTFVASSGDDGAYGSGTSTKIVEYPAVSANVLGVGGTTMDSNADGSYGTESGWGNGTNSRTQGGSGGGISNNFSQPSYQSAVVPTSITTTKRTVPDVALDADPATGVPIYDVYDEGSSTPWAQYGGTSLATPMWAGILAIADQGRALNGLPTLDGPSGTLPKIYALPASDFHDVTTGNNGYAAGPGYDLVTGRGTPIVNLVVRDLSGPDIGALTVGPNAVPAGTPATLTASNVYEAGGTVSSVTFYRESNGTSGLQIGSDTLLGTGTQNGSTWTFTVSTSGLAAGTYTFYAVATDSTGASSPVAVATLTVGTTVYADTRWAGLANGTTVDADPTEPGTVTGTIGTNAFASVNAAIAAVPNQGTVVVNGASGGSYGNFSEDVNINHPITLVVQYGPVTFNSLADAVSNATILLSGVPLTVGGDNLSTTVAGIIVGSGGLTKNGTGTLTLSGANTYTGATTVAGGTLSVNSLANGGSASSVGAATNSAANLVVQGGATLLYTGATASTDHGFTVGSGGGTFSVSTAGTTLTVGGYLGIGTNGLTLTGAGNATFTNVVVGTNMFNNTTGTAGPLTKGTTAADSGTDSFTYPNALSTGNITVNDGTLVLGSETLSSSEVLTIAAGAAVNSTGTLFLTANSTSTTSEVTGAGTLNLTATTNGPTSPDIYFNWNDADGAVSNWGTRIATAVNLGAAQRYLFGKTNQNSFGEYGQNADAVFTGPITGTGGLTVIGQDNFTGSHAMEVPFVLAGADTFTGTLEIQRGSVYLDNAAALTQGNALLLDPASGNNARLFLWGFNATVSNLTSSGAGTATIANGNVTNPATSLPAATLTVVENSATTYGGLIAPTVTEFDGNTGSGTVGALSLAKSGTAALTLTAANTYTGTTQVNAGTLLVNNTAGSGTGAGNVTVNAGGTLGGTGTVIPTTGNTVTVNASGTLTGILSVETAVTANGVVQPAGSGSHLLTGNVTFSASGSLNVALNGSTLGSGYVQLYSTGTVTLNGATLNVSLGYTPTAGTTFDIVTNNDNMAVVGTFNGLPEGAVFTSGSQAFTITYHGGAGHDVVLSAISASPPAITSANTTTFTVARSNSFTVTATGTPTPTLSESGTDVLPSGVTFTAATGVLSGSPASGTGGTYTLHFTAHNGVGSDANQTFTLTVNESPIITSAGSTTFTVGSAGTFTVVATGSPAPTFTVTSGTLPSGVTLNATTGVLGGTPAAGTGGTYNLNITASNGVYPSATQPFTLTVNQAPAITSANNTTFTVGTAGSFTVTATGYPAPTFALNGPLPTGLSLDASTGILSGTPASGTGGNYNNYIVTASNGVSPNASQNFTLVINQAPSVVTQPVNRIVTSGGTASFTVTPSGTPSPTLQWYVSTDGGATFNPVAGATGMTLTLSNVTVAMSSNEYQAVLTNVVGTATSNAATLTVNPITTATTLTDNGPNPSILDQAVSFTVTVTGGVPDGSTVTLQDASNGNAVVGTGTLTSGTTTITVSALALGTHALFAVYSGDSDHTGSQSGQVSQLVNAATGTTTTTTITDLGPNPSLNFGDTIQPVTFLVHVSAADNAALTGDLVSLLDNNVALAGTSTALDANNNAIITVANFAVGSHPIAATFAAQETFAPSTSPQVTQNVVSSFQVGAATLAGNAVQLVFDGPIDPNTTQLYYSPSATAVAPDVTLTGPSGSVKGSLVLDATNPNVATFVATAGPLAAGSYTVAVTTAVQALGGATLTADYSQALTAAPVTPVVTAANVARGPGETVNVPNTGTGLPITVSGLTAAVQSASFTLTYDPTLLTVTAAALSSDAATSGDLVLKPIIFTSIDAHHMQIAFTIIGGSGGGHWDPSGDTGTLLTLSATVPDNAPYTQKALLNTQNVVINGTAAQGDDAVDVNAFPGDVHADGHYTGLDATLISRVVTGQGTGFTPFKDLDPFLIGSVTGSGTLAVNGLDATDVSSAAVGSFPSVIPQPPTGFTITGPLGPDPRLYLAAATGGDGQTVTVQERFNVSGADPSTEIDAIDSVIEYDPSKFTVSNIRAGSLLPGFSVTTNVDAVHGVIRVSEFTANPAQAPNPTDGDVLLLDFTVNSSAPLGPSPLKLAASYTDANNTSTTTAVYNATSALTLGPAPQNPSTLPLSGSTVSPFVTNVDNYFSVVGHSGTEGFPANTTATAGGTVTIPINFSNGPVPFDIAAVDNAIKFNPLLLQVTNVTVGSLLMGFSLTTNVDNTNGVLRTSEFTANEAAVSGGQVGAVLQITFAVNGSASGSIPLYILQSYTDSNNTTTTTAVYDDNGAITLTPAPQGTGSNPVFVTGVDGNLNIVVQPNQPPYASLPVPAVIPEALFNPAAHAGLQTVTPNTVAFSSATGDAIIVTDSDYTASGSPETTTLTLTGSPAGTSSGPVGTLTAAASGQAMVSGGGTQPLVITGSPSDITATLSSLVYTPGPGFFGTATLTVSTTDNGNSGYGGSLTDVRSTSITVVGLFLSEIDTLKGNTTNPSQYIEVFSTVPSYTIPPGVYLTGINGVSGSTPAAGVVADIFNLSNFTTGSNGYLALLQKSEKYSSGGFEVAGGNQLDNSGTGVGFGSGNTSKFGTVTGVHTGSTRPSGQLATDILLTGAESFLLIQTPTAPTTTTNIDPANTGNPSNQTSAYNGWNVLDSVGILDSASTSHAYAAITFKPTGATGTTLAGSNVVNTGTWVANYVGRIAQNTGSSGADWLGSVVTGTPSSGMFFLGSPNSTAFAGQPLNSIGGPNDWAPQLTVAVNDDSSNQHSQVAELTLTFSTPVNIVDLASDFVLKDASGNPLSINVSDPNTGATTMDATGPVPDSAATLLFVTFNADATHTFNFITPYLDQFGNTLTVGLVDGNYFLNTKVADISAASNSAVLLDGAKNGMSGSTTSGTGNLNGNGVNQVDEFWRLFGDTEGRRQVDGVDTTNFRTVNGVTAATSGMTAGILAASESNNTVTITTSAPSGFLMGEIVNIVGLPAGYNGSFVILSVNGNTFTYMAPTSGLTAVTNPTGAAATLNSYQWYLDYNEDGVIDVGNTLDQTQLINRLFTQLPA